MFNLTDDQAIAVVRVGTAAALFAVALKILLMPTPMNWVFGLKVTMASVFGGFGGALIGQQRVQTAENPVTTEVVDQ